MGELEDYSVMRYSAADFVADKCFEKEKVAVVVAVEHMVPEMVAQVLQAQALDSGQVLVTKYYLCPYRKDIAQNFV